MLHGAVATVDLGHDGVKAMDVCCVEDSLFEQGADQSPTVIGVHRKGVDEQCIFDVDRTVERSGPVGDDPDDEPGVVGGDVDVRITGPGCDFVGNIGANDRSTSRVYRSPRSAQEKVRRGWASLGAAGRKV